MNSNESHACSYDLGFTTMMSTTHEQSEESPSVRSYMYVCIQPTVRPRKKINHSISQAMNQWVQILGF